MKLAVIGGGAMGEAIIAAVLEAGVVTTEDVAVADIATARLEHLRKTYGVSTTVENKQAVDGADFVLLALKPQDLDRAVPAIAAGLAPGATVISIMAGVTLSRLTRLLGPAVVRAMPNTPAQVQAGMTVWTAAPALDETARAASQRILAALGSEAFVPEERYLDMATALSGSGPAYVFLFLEALTDAGVHIGLSRDLAARMALQTVLGSAQYASATGKHPAELRNQVTSPGGTTAAALLALETAGFRAGILEAVIAAFERSRALGAEEKH
jgi:pyrroline-5-carboxylate reductase